MRSTLAQLPPVLSVTSAPPKVLFSAGEPLCLLKPMVAIVGTRRPSLYGVRMAYLLARDLARAEVCVVSGLARGIDGAAHSGALAGSGLTVGVLGHGLDRIYPREHGELAHRICRSGGLLLSEYPDGTPPLPHHFPCRNRIIAGLSLAVVVIEAAEKSGSLITAGFAADEGREVFVVPSRVEDGGFAGSHRLIQSGAGLVTCADDVLAALDLTAVPVPKQIRAESHLERHFLEQGGVLDLSRIRALSRWRSHLHDALVSGQVIECGMQNYIWVG